MSEEEGWVRDPKVLDVVCALNGLQVGDSVVIHQQGLAEEATVKIAGVCCNRNCTPAHCCAKLGHPCVGRTRSGFLIHRKKLIAWKPKKRVG